MFNEGFNNYTFHSLSICPRLRDEFINGSRGSTMSQSKSIYDEDFDDSIKELAQFKSLY